MTFGEGLLLAVGGVVAGIINTNAGGGSLITVPLLNLVGVPGTVANGTNRVGVLVQNLGATVEFRRLGVSGLRAALPVILPTLAGALVGAVAISGVTDEAFERAFGLLMVPLLVLSLWQATRTRPVDDERTLWPWWLSGPLYFLVGVYGGAFQAGVGLLLLLALSRTGYDLVRANSIKVVVILVQTAITLPVFIARDQVDWAAALVLSVGFGVGGALGARVAVIGGEKVIRPILVVAVIVLAGSMLGFY
ncbi:MAG: sulfite exporter TauE/SafE family protein [Acidimicrobiales bacterium]